jgi:hypothetical protein
MKFDRDQLLEAAARQTKFSDFGEPAFESGLNALLDAVADDKALPEAARSRVEARLSGPLVQRLQLYADRARYPEIAVQKIERPLVVIGMPRSGTTFLHALLAQDPSARSPLTWQVGQPSPPPRRETIASDPRIAAVDAAMDQMPDEFKRAHMIGASLPEECISILQMGYFSPAFDAGLDVPGYMEWFRDADGSGPFQTHRHMLQHLQAFTDGSHWVLKSPPHMFHMDTLFDAYPDARIVFPHRDPAETLASLTSLIAIIRRWSYSEVDMKRIGRDQMANWAIALERALAFRARPGHEDRFFDVSYKRLIKEPMAVVRGIYGHFGMELTSAAEAAMQRFLDEKPKDKHGAHRYTLEDAGLTRAGVDERFAFYLDREFADQF